MQKYLKKVLLALMAISLMMLVACSNESDNAKTDRSQESVNDRTDRTDKTDKTIIDNNDEKLTPKQIFDNNKDAIFQVYTCVNGEHVGFGSGFFIDSTGTAVTNHHVMRGATGAVAVMMDGSQFDITGYYSYECVGNDFAIIQVDTKGKACKYLTVGNSDNVGVGESVYAVGGPNGDPLTFTDGIISRIVADELLYGIYKVNGMFQTTASIYGGNSGGPLLNDKGHVIGINSAKKPDQESKQWAIPINQVLPNGSSTLYPLPIGGNMQAQWDGSIKYLQNYPFVIDFASVSRNTVLLSHGYTKDIYPEAASYYDYVYAYDLPSQDFSSDTKMYVDALFESNFILQSNETDANGVYYQITCYQPDNNISIGYTYFFTNERLLICIGAGNVYGSYNEGDNAQAQGSGYLPGYPAIPDFSSASRSNSVLQNNGYTADIYPDIAGYYYLSYVYFLSNQDFVSYTMEYDEELVNSGFVCQNDYFDDDGIYHAFFYNSYENLSLYYEYDQAYEDVIICIGSGNAYE